MCVTKPFALSCLVVGILASTSFAQPDPFAEEAQSDPAQNSAEADPAKDGVTADPFRFESQTIGGQSHVVDRGNRPDGSRTVGNASVRFDRGWMQRDQ